jgi:hypothetical protein
MANGPALRAGWSGSTRRKRRVSGRVFTGSIAALRARAFVGCTGRRVGGFRAACWAYIGGGAVTRKEGASDGGVLDVFVVGVSVVGGVEVVEGLVPLI